MAKDVEPPKFKPKRGRPRIPTITPDIGDFEGKLPPRPINWEQVIYWLNLDATQEEIAGSFHVSVSTLRDRIREHYGCDFQTLKEKVCGPLKIGLRGNQYKMSAHNATMAIWLGKQWLGQTDPDKRKQEMAYDMVSGFLEYMDKTRNPVGNEPD